MTSEQQANLGRVLKRVVRLIQTLIPDDEDANVSILVRLGDEAILHAGNAHCQHCEARKLRAVAQTIERGIAESN